MYSQLLSRIDQKINKIEIWSKKILAIVLFVFEAIVEASFNDVTNDFFDIISNLPKCLMKLCAIKQNQARAKSKRIKVNS